ncbi:MAG: hypothetical protein LQ343_006685 [Gyalolechia ehrenbergii]|nr:MAG: hypothetical protein LQ343_006685 [Gyalolechia ehrenbergii]
MDRIFAKSMFSRDVARALGITGELSHRDLSILLTYLARDRPSLVYDGTIVKLASPEEVMLPISKEDRAIASLKSLINDINEQICSLEKRVGALTEKSQSAVKMKNRTSALAALRLKRSAESALAKRVDTLLQLEEVYGKIEQASDQTTILQVMRGSTAVLRNLNAKTGSIQDVEDVLDGLKEEMGKVEEIGTVINQAGQESNAIIEDEVDEELEALMRQSQSSEEERAVEETKRRLAEVHLASVSNANRANHSTPSTDKTSADPTADSNSPIHETKGASESMALAKKIVPSNKSLHSQSREREDMAPLAI